jgi:hypothetical protein
VQLLHFDTRDATAATVAAAVRELVSGAPHSNAHEPVAPAHTIHSHQRWHVRRIPKQYSQSSKKGNEHLRCCRERGEAEGEREREREREERGERGGGDVGYDREQSQ